MTSSTSSVVIATATGTTTKKGHPSSQSMTLVQAQQSQSQPTAAEVATSLSVSTSSAPAIVLIQPPGIGGSSSACMSQRKGSNATSSTISSHRSSGGGKNTMNSNSYQHSHTTSTSNNNNTISDRRLPRKKRKEHVEEESSSHSIIGHEQQPQHTALPLHNDDDDDNRITNTHTAGESYINQPQQHSVHTNEHITTEITTPKERSLSSSYEIASSSSLLNPTDTDMGIRKGSMGDHTTTTTTTTTAAVAAEEESLSISNHTTNYHPINTTIRKTSHDTNSLAYTLPSLDSSTIELFDTIANTTTTNPIIPQHDNTTIQNDFMASEELTKHISTPSMTHTSLEDSHKRNKPDTTTTTTDTIPIVPISLSKGDGIDDSSQDETFASSGHRLLMEAIMITNPTTGNDNDGGGISSLKATGIELTGGSHGGSNSSNTNNHNKSKMNDHSNNNNNTINNNNASSSIGLNLPYRERFDSNAGGTTATSRLDRYNHLHGTSFHGRRDRLESWGGMSDLSVPATSDSIFATAMAAATNLHNGLLFEDPDHDPTDQFLLPVMSMSHSYSMEEQKLGSIPTKISLPQYRDRLGSIASLGDLSVSNMNAPLIVDGIDVPGSDLHAFVAAAMASVGDQLTEIAGAMEELTGESITSEDLKRELIDEGDSSVASPMIGAISDTTGGGGGNRRPRAWSTSSRISVDLDAVQAAVDAAYSFAVAPTTEKKSMDTKLNGKKNTKSCIPKRQLPLKRGRKDLTPKTESTKKDGPKERNNRSSNKKRPRKGESSPDSPIKGTNLPPLKKRPIEKRTKRQSIGATPNTLVAQTAAALKTPIVSNRSSIPEPVMSELHITPPIVGSSSSDGGKKDTLDSGGGGGQANQKWENMFTCMVEFAEERQMEETKNMTEIEKKAWVWDGNVPTNFKTKDGMALGRWVNNQRSAKAKGSLKDEREQRLINAGLKWSVVASNSWNEMLEELSIYIKEQHRQGKVWDGNVPTNYQIKSRPHGGFNGEDKNLGRWVNRQRSLYQSGKLRKERKILLENVGLKWSMLATTSWDGMYETLKEYSEQQTKKSGGGDDVNQPSVWDGNVPATYRTNDNPPRALGRWVNRQRSAYAKKKLKKEFVDKLNELGLKWSVHQRHGEQDDDDVDDDVDGDFGDIDDPIEDCVDGGAGTGADFNGEGNTTVNESNDQANDDNETGPHAV